MRILAIETSCDESGVAIIDVVQNSATTVATIRSNQLASQAAIHAQYGGVFPTVAKREHARALTPLLVKALEESKDLHEQTAKPPQEVIGKIMEILQREQELFVQLALFFAQYGKPSIDAIAVTHGPGLEPALWVGVNFARSLATVWNVPLIAMNHMEGHIVAGLVAHTFSKRSPEVTLDTPAYPLLSLLISGGHTEFVLSTKAYTYHVIGTTRDDAAGECFDKCARMLDLPYPGGPQISKLAAQARVEDLPHDFTLPRPMLRDETLDMSFSGLKTAVLRLVQQHTPLTDTQKKIIAREVEDAIADVLVTKAMNAIRSTNARTLVISGGVAANDTIVSRMRAELAATFPDVDLRVSPKSITTDNALMIAFAAAHHATDNDFTDPALVGAHGTLSLNTN